MLWKRALILAVVVITVLGNFPPYVHASENLCPCCSSVQSGIVRLEGDELHKLISTALSDNAVKDLKGFLIRRGLRPEISHVVGIRTVNGVEAIAIPFAADESVFATIRVFRFHDSIRAFAVLMEHQVPITYLWTPDGIKILGSNSEVSIQTSLSDAYICWYMSVLHCTLLCAPLTLAGGAGAVLCQLACEAMWVPICNSY